MNLGLKGKVALVTGGSKGIGKAISKSLAHQGTQLAVTAREAEALNAVILEIEELGGEAIAIAADATDRHSVVNVIESTIQRFGQLDILVNNVGGCNSTALFSDLTTEDWFQAFELNVMTIVHFVQESLPWLRKSHAGRVINIASISGVEPGILNPNYTSSKAAVINLSKYLSNWLADDNILVNVVCPGQVSTDARKRHAEHVSVKEGISINQAINQIDIVGASRIPLGRIGKSEDIASLVTFLASEHAAWITGSCFHINGGKHRSAF